MVAEESFSVGHASRCACNSCVDQLCYKQPHLHERPGEKGLKGELLGVVWRRSKAKNAQEAHEAIRPTKPDASPERCGLPPRSQLARLYGLIWARALASQMAPAAMLQVVPQAAMRA